MGDIVMDVEVDVKNFWENKHKIEDVAALSGCLYGETIDFLELNAYIKPGIHVLEVGVGLGYVTEGLFKAGTKVTALDISDVSLERVKNCCERVYNVEDIQDLPSNYFDIIICNNVVQHVTTGVLIEELKELIRALKTTGVFAVEFVSSEGFEDNGKDPHIEAIKNGGLCRSPAFLEGIFNDLGGICALTFDKKVDIGIVQGHHVFHVRRER